MDKKNVLRKPMSLLQCSQPWEVYCVWWWAQCCVLSSGCEGELKYTLKIMHGETLQMQRSKSTKALTAMGQITHLTYFGMQNLTSTNPIKFAPSASIAILYSSLNADTTFMTPVSTVGWATKPRVLTAILTSKPRISADGALAVGRFSCQQSETS